MKMGRAISFSLRTCHFMLISAVFLSAVPTTLAFVPALPKRLLAHGGKSSMGCFRAHVPMGRVSSCRWTTSFVPALAPLATGLRAGSGTAEQQTGNAEQQQTSPLIIYDGTLTQRFVDFSVEDRVKVAQMLDEFGMHYIEAGWPLLNPADRVFFVRARDELEPECFGKLVAMAALPPDGDTKGVVTVAEGLLKTGAVNVGVALNLASTTGKLVALEATLKLLGEGKVAHGTVVVHLHNAMHAYRADAAGVSSFIASACKYGADVIMLVDSGGTATPWEVETMVAELQSTVEWKNTKLGISCMDHAELSVAAAVYAAKQGAHVLGGTMNGFGGAVDLAAVVPILQLKMGHKLVTPEALAGLTRLSRSIDEQVRVC